MTAVAVAGQTVLEVLVMLDDAVAEVDPEELSALAAPVPEVSNVGICSVCVQSHNNGSTPHPS
jgi:hypothetical protein